jgi:hypothetical protein
MGYPDVIVCNSTPYPAHGQVKYSACSTDDWKAPPNGCCVPIWRGLCLITQITATVDTPTGPVTAIPYTSSGTSYSQFIVISYGGGYMVTRVVSEADDLGVIEPGEPTRGEQKKAGG